MRKLNKKSLEICDYIEKNWLLGGNPITLFDIQKEILAMFTSKHCKQRLIKKPSNSGRTTILCLWMVWAVINKEITHYIVVKNEDQRNYVRDMLFDIIENLPIHDKKRIVNHVYCRSNTIWIKHRKFERSRHYFIDDAQFNKTLLATIDRIRDSGSKRFVLSLILNPDDERLA